MNDYSQLPLLLRPVIRMVSVTPGVDRDAYIRTLVDALFDDIDDATRHAMASEIAVAAPLALADADGFLANLAPAQAEPLRDEANRLDILARRWFPRPQEQVVRSHTSYVTPTGGEVPGAGGTVVWVREGSLATVQFELPRLRLALADGAVERDSRQLSPLERSSTPIIRLAVLPTGHEIFSGVVQLASSVSWALPPPWGAVATGALSLVQMLLGASEPEKPSPFDELKSGLQEYISQHTLEANTSDFNDFANNLADKTDELGKWTADTLDHAGIAVIDNLLSFLDENAYGLNMVHNRCTQVVDGLNGLTLDNVKTSIEAAATGLTLLLTGQKVYMQLLALEAGYAQKLGDTDANQKQVFLDTTALWIARYREIRKSFGVDNPDDGDRWIARLSETITKLTNDRLAKLTAPHRTTRQVFHPPPVGSTTGAGSYYETQAGWAWSDGAEGTDELAHFYPDTWEGGDNCGNKGTLVDHQSDAQAAFDAHKRDVNSAIDTAVGTATRAVNGWKASLSDMEKTMPLPAPKLGPTATPLADGPQTPLGADWIAGYQVQYAYQYSNLKGPSDVSPWSSEFTVGTTAYATVSGLSSPKDDPTATVLLLRKWTPPGGTSVLRTVQVLSPPIAATVQDKKSFTK